MYTPDNTLFRGTRRRDPSGTIDGTIKMATMDGGTPHTGWSSRKNSTPDYSKTDSNSMLAEHRDNRSDDLIFNSEKNRPSFLQSSARKACMFAIFICISTMIAVLIVYYTSPKPPAKTCAFILKSEALSSIREDSRPNSVAVGDMDGDGLLDIVVPNSGTDNVGVFLQSSNRTFSDQMTYSTGLGSVPYAVAVADVDGDRRSDIAVANFGTHNVGIFLGTGNGSFWPQKIFSTASSRPRWIAAGDFNNDHLNDLAIVNGGTNDIGIFIGDGHGNFMNWKTFSTGFDSIPYSLAVADLNHDTQLDIVVANSGTGNVGVFIGHGDGSLSAQAIFYIGQSSSPYSVSLADVNKDNHTDIVVACPNTNAIAVLRGSGNGLFSTATRYSTGSDSVPRSVIIGDFDNDTNVDIVAATYSSSSIMIFFGRGNNSFADAVTFYTSKDSNPYAVAAGHFSNDTRLDLAVVNYDYNYVDIVLTYRNYSFTSPTPYPTTDMGSKASFVIAANLNNDTRLDLVVMNYGSNVLDIFLGNANGMFSRQHSYSTASALDTDGMPGAPDTDGGAYGTIEPTPGSQTSFQAAADLGPISIAIGNLDNDSYVDIAVTNYDSNNLGIYYGKGDGSFPQSSDLSTGPNSGPCAALIADLNGDGKQDAAVVLYVANQIWIFLGNGRRSFPDVKTLSVAADSRPVWAGAADFNNDQRQDIAVVNNLNGDVGVFFGLGNGLFSYQIVYSVGTGASPNGGAIGDFNRDGRMDLLVNVYYNRAFDVLLGDGNGSFVNVTKYSVGSLSRPSWSTLGDWNNDSRVDVIVSSCNTGSVLVFLGDGNGVFLRGQTYLMDNNTCPLSSAGGDFNGDGVADLVVTNGRTNQIAVFQGYTFMNGLRQSTYSTGAASHPRGVALGRMTTDRQLDVIMANFGLGQLGFLKGYPNGSFPSATSLSTGALSFPTSVAVEDLDKDQKLDLVVANSLSGNVGIFYGYNNGTFTDQRTYSASPTFAPQALICADFNHDQRMDIAVISSDKSRVSIMLKYDTAVFRKDNEYFTGTNSYPHAVAVGDFNNDGRPDFVTVNRGSASISIFLGLGNGTFSGPTRYEAGQGSPSYGIVVGHFNNDTFLDIVVSHYWNNSISLFLGAGNGTFARFRTPSTNSPCLPIGLAVGDLNNDRRMDVIAVCEKNGSVSVFLGRGNGTFADAVTYRPPFDATFLYAVVSDFNNDNISDIAVTDTMNSAIVLFRGNGDGTFVSAGNYSTGWASRPRPIAAADLNKDGSMDIVVGNSGTDFVCVFLGYGNGSFPSGVTYPIDSGMTSYGLIISDLNNDAQLDVAVAGYGGNKVAVLLGLINGTFFNALTFSTGLYSQPSFLAVADFNNDSRRDLVVSESGAHRAGIYLGSAAQDFLFAPAYPLRSNSQPTSIASGDFNGDNHLDVIVADNATDSVIVLFGSGVGTFYRADFYSTGNNSRPCSVAVADLNNDHRLDIVVANSNADCVGVFLGNGDGTFLNQSTYFTGRQSKPYAVALVDFDNDTRLDVAVANYESSNVAIFIGHGNGNFSTPMTFSTGFGSHPFSLAAGDVNNDHFTDLVVTNNGYGNIDVLMRTC